SGDFCRRVLSDESWIFEQVGGANGDEPVSPVAIATSVAAHPRRSPFSLAHMMSNRTALVIVAVVVTAGVFVAPVAIRGGLRYYALHKVLSLPEARQRLSVRPSRRTFTTLPHVHLINLGYATFDTGSTNPISIETSSSGASVLLTNGDVSMAFLPPFGPEKGTNLISVKVPAAEARRHPHTLAYMQEMETNQMAAEMKVEETTMLPFSAILSMSGDDFLVYSMKLAVKAGNRFGSKEVEFFESPDAKGIARFGKTTNDERFAAVFLASADGSKEVGLLLTATEASPKRLVESLDPILRSFRFTTEGVDDRDRIKAMIRGAGIHQRQESQPDGAANGSQPLGFRRRAGDGPVRSFTAVAHSECSVGNR
ncbi:MAG TPA: hypothetical protein VEL06_02545, partial [Haliangiales bacterium]|nr:hypothetical protein [Haliangiales bacterium]